MSEIIIKYTNRVAFVTLQVFILYLVTVSQSLSQNVDTILYNGKILTAVKDFTVVEALVAHTRNNAEMLFLADDLGSLEIGKLADLIVINKDYMTIAENEISSINSMITTANGKIVYKKQ